MLRQVDKMTGNKLFLSLIAGLVLLVIWLKFDPGHPQISSTAVDPNIETRSNNIKELEQRIELLETELTQELLQRQQLEQRLTKLEEANIASPLVSRTENNQTIPQKKTRTETKKKNKLTLQDRLINAGLALETVQSMQQRVDQNQLEMLEMRNQAIRAGADDSLEYSEKMHELNDSTRGLREEFGDQLYDQYLYASGRPNRVVIRDVYSGSAADNAGLQPGDMFIQYASSNIFSMSELRQATVEGTAGETVLIEIKREDNSLSTSAPRGPLGISMGMIRYQP